MGTCETSRTSIGVIFYEFVKFSQLKIPVSVVFTGG